MNDLDRSDDEQVAALKNWWRANGTSLIAGVAIALAAIFGWRYWQQHEANQIAAASISFQELLAAGESLPEGERAETEAEAASSVAFFADELISSAQGSDYATFARLIKARVAVSESRYADAEAELRLALSAVSEKPALQVPVKARLARVLAMQEEYEEALNLLVVEAGQPHSAYFKELAGDIHFVAGDPAAARAQYEQALQAALLQGQDTGLLQAKVDDLAGA